MHLDKKAKARWPFSSVSETERERTGTEITKQETEFRISTWLSGMIAGKARRLKKTTIVNLRLLRSP